MAANGLKDVTTTRVLRAIQRSCEYGRSLKSVRKALKLDSATLMYHVRKLKDDGKIRRVQRGFYTVKAREK